MAMQNQQMAQQMQAAAAAAAAANGGSAASDRQGVFFPQQMGYMPQPWNYPVQRLSQNCPAGMLSKKPPLITDTRESLPSFGLSFGPCRQILQANKG